MNCKTLSLPHILFPLFIFFLPLLSMAQSGNSLKEKSKQFVYEFNVTGLNSEQEASKMDSSLTGHGGIVKWETDYHHKKVKVTTSFYIQFKDLMIVCRVNKCEASEEHTLTEVESQE